MNSCNFTNKANSHTPEMEIIHTRPKLCHFGRYVVRAKLFCLKSFVPVTGLKCSYGELNFHPVTEISVAGSAQPLISGAPNHRFLSNAFKCCFRLSGVLKVALKKIYLFGYSRGNLSILELLRALLSISRKP